LTIDLQPIGHSPLVGQVVEFDEPRGLGVLRPEVGRKLDFHCTAIEDGSRRIEVGTVVTFTVRAGRLGRLEAATIRPLQPESGSTEGS
jgi:cold shock CspA family protein